jgi:hypothetical protein
VKAVARRNRLKLIAVSVFAYATIPCGGAEKAQFNRDIRPILARNCFSCHGPDSASRKADLRLDRREAAIEAEAIVPGKPDESSLVDRIFASNAGEIMPPPSSHKKLTTAEKGLLKRWIAEGAEYQPHWSFIAPARPPLPAVKKNAWVRNPIDRFVLAKLEQTGLSPAPAADARTLARRLHLDLTGLPPEPDDVERFAADKSPDAVDKLVDRLLGSKHWGEHRARYWLDAARYADTHGLHFDNFREMWIYRDWVIDAFNRNLPFDRFTVEQLSGDLLPEPTLEQLIASGFNRCNITTNEGGTIPEENLVLYTRDRTETTARVWLGITANCAVCHDHKFDPLSQKEFYQLSAFFNNSTQGALDGNIKDTAPVIVVPPPPDRARWNAVSAELAKAGAEVEGRRRSAGPDFEKWLAQAKADRLPLDIPADKLLLHASLSEGSGDHVCATVDGQPRELPVKPDAQWASGQVAQNAWKVGPKQVLEIPTAGDFERKQAFSCSAWIRLPKDRRSGAVVARMDDRNGFRGWDLWVEDGRVGGHVIHQWPNDALKAVSTKPHIQPERWHHVCVTHDGSGKAAGMKVYVDGAARETRASQNALAGTIRTEAPLTIGQRKTGSRLDGMAVQDVRIYGRALAADEVKHLVRDSRILWLVAKPAAKRTESEKKDLLSWWLTAADPASRELAQRLARLEKEKEAIRTRSTIAHVTQEQKEPAKAYVLFRGEYDKRRDEVTPATPSMLAPMPAELPRNRLGFARWLLRPEHPLTARVTVNRFWQELFGTGIVKTSEDLGSTGELPSHPELLDWLAVEFRESGWDVKRLFRLMVTSAAYRQAATVTPDKLERDPDNRLLSRGPRFRMDAEMLRDCALAASGLMSATVGGPSVKPYQPTGVWEAVAMIGSNTREYKQDSGDALYRRSLYTFWKRAAPPASMEILNAPSREVCTVRRERTNTPLQALVTLNDPQFIEAARKLAETALRQGGADHDTRIRFLTGRVIARPPCPEELAMLRAELDRLAAYYQAHPDDAKKLVDVGESKSAAPADASALAAWTMLANTLMNLDEAINK